MKDKKKRTRLIGLRLTSEEFDKLEGWRCQSTTSEISEFIRRVLFGKPITMQQRNQSLDDFMAEMIRLRTELSAIGNNFNQAVKRLHQIKEAGEVEAWAERYHRDQEQLLERVGAIKNKINEISDQWLR
jgi:MobC-like protein